MESRRLSRRLRGVAPETEEYQDRCFFCLIVFTINSLTRSSIICLSCCRKYVHAACQTRWLQAQGRCAHCQGALNEAEQPTPTENIIGIQRDVAVEALQSFAHSGIADMNGIEVGINK